jgi:hypothetical protein
MTEPFEQEWGTGPEIARRRIRRLLAASLSVICIAVTVPLVAGFIGGSRHHRPGHHTSPGALIAALAAVAVTLAVTGLVLWRLLNRPDYQRVMQYDWRRRMRVAKALRRGQSIEPGDEAVADAVVGLMRKQKGIFWFQPVLIVTWIVIAFTRHGFGRWLYLGLALVTGPALLYSIRTQRRTVRNWDFSKPPAADPRDDAVGA